MQSPDFITKLMPKIVPQTKIAFIGYALIVLSYVIMMIMTKTYDVIAWVVLVWLLVLLVVGPYVVNCTVVGQCNVAAWIIGIFVLVSAIIHSIKALMMLYGGKASLPYSKFASPKSKK
jgi:hypothetical protein